jgi:hypothetical protein
MGSSAASAQQGSVLRVVRQWRFVVCVTHNAFCIARRHIFNMCNVFYTSASGALFYVLYIICMSYINLHHMLCPARVVRLVRLVITRCGRRGSRIHIRGSRPPPRPCAKAAPAGRARNTPVASSHSAPLRPPRLRRPPSTLPHTTDPPPPPNPHARMHPHARGPAESVAPGRAPSRARAAHIARMHESARARAHTHTSGCSRPARTCALLCDRLRALRLYSAALKEAYKQERHDRIYQDSVSAVHIVWQILLTAQGCRPPYPRSGRGEVGNMNGPGPAGSRLPSRRRHREGA